MKRLSIVISVVGGIVAGAIAGYAQSIPFGWSILEAEEAAGRQLFSDHCAACHVQQPGSHAILGPSLEGIVGRAAASVAGFPYSDALKKSDLTWTEDNLRKWIADSAHMVPATLMPHVSISDPAEQIYLVAYLKKLKKPGNP